MADKYWFAGTGTFNVGTNWAGGAPQGPAFGLTATFTSGSNSITFSRSIGSGNPGITTGGTNIGALIRDSSNNLIGTISSGTWPTYTLVANSSFTGTNVAVRFAATAASTAPSAGDNVFFIATSSVGAFTVTFSTTTSVTNFTVEEGSVTFSGAGALNISGSFSIASSTTTWSGTGVITFTSTTGIKTITTNGTSFGSSNFTFNGIGGTWQLQDALTLTGTRTCTLTNGTLDLNNKTLTTGLFNSTNSNTRSIAFGTSGNITLIASGGTMWNTSLLTGFSVSGTNPTVNVSNNSATAATITTGTMAETTQAIGFNFTIGTYSLTLTAGTKRDLKFTGFTGTVSSTAQTIYGDLVITSVPTLPTAAAWTLGGTAATSRNINLSGITSGSSLPNLTFNATNATFVWQGNSTLLSSKFTYTSGNINLNNYSFNIDILSLIPSTGSPTLTAGTTGRFNVSGTNGTVVTINVAFTLIDNWVSIYLTAPSATNRTVGIGAVNIASGYGVSLYFSGGATDTVSLNASLRDLNTTGFNGTLTSVSGSLVLYGNMNIASTTTVNFSSIALYLRGTGTTYTIDNASRTMTVNQLLLNGGNYKLNCDISSATFINTIGSNGILDLNGKNITAQHYYSSPGSNNIIAMSNGFINITGNETTTGSAGLSGAWNVTHSNSLSFSGTGEVRFTATGPKTIYAASGVAAVLPTINQSTSGSLTINGDCICNDIISTSTSPTTISITPGYTLTCSNFSLSGTSSAQVTLNSATSGSVATVSKASGIVNASYLTIKDIIAAGGATWNAYTTNGNVNNGNNTGWIFAAATKLYLGIKSRVQAYLGVKTDAQLYKGTKTIGWI